MEPAPTWAHTVTVWATLPEQSLSCHLFQSVSTRASESLELSQEVGRRIEMRAARTERVQ